MPLALSQGVFGAPQCPRYDLLRNFEGFGQSTQGSPTLLACNMTPTKGIDSTCGFQGVPIAETKAEGVAIESKLAHPCLNQLSQGQLDGHSASLHADVGAGAVLL